MSDSKTTVESMLFALRDLMCTATDENSTKIEARIVSIKHEISTADLSAPQVTELECEEERLQLILRLYKDAEQKPEVEDAAAAYQLISNAVSLVRKQLFEQPRESLCLGLVRGNNGELLDGILRSAKFLDSEARKDLGLLFKSLFRTIKAEMVTYFEERPALLQFLLTGYEEPSSAHATGSVLRQCIRQESLCKLMLANPVIYQYFGYVQDSTFEIASDAFATFHLMLTKHKVLAAKFLSNNFNPMIKEKWNDLLMTRNFATKRQALKNLRDLLTDPDRTYYRAMIKYVNDDTCLAVLVSLLLEKSFALRNDAFHLFKMFVLNPKKQDAVVKVLVGKSKRLIDALESLKPTDEVKQVILAFKKTIADAAAQQAALGFGPDSDIDRRSSSVSSLNGSSIESTNDVAPKINNDKMNGGSEGNSAGSSAEGGGSEAGNNVSVSNVSDVSNHTSANPADSVGSNASINPVGSVSSIAGVNHHDSLGSNASVVNRDEAGDKHSSNQHSQEQENKTSAEAHEAGVRENDANNPSGTTNSVAKANEDEKEKERERARECDNDNEKESVIAGESPNATAAKPRSISVHVREESACVTSASSTISGSLSLLPLSFPSAAALATSASISNSEISAPASNPPGRKSVGGSESKAVDGSELASVDPSS